MEDSAHQHRASFHIRGVEGATTTFDKTLAKARDKAKARARRADSIGHLGPEAVAAFVDGEMDPKATHRVHVHLVHCAECRADVREQRRASQWVRNCNVDHQVRAPKDLMAKLAGIAAEAADEDSAAPKKGRNKYGAHGGTSGVGERDILDKVEMVIRAIKHNQGR